MARLQSAFAVQLGITIDQKLDLKGWIGQVLQSPCVAEPGQAKGSNLCSAIGETIALVDAELLVNSSRACSLHVIESHLVEIGSFQAVGQRLSAYGSLSALRPRNSKRRLIVPDGHIYNRASTMATDVRLFYLAL